MNNVSFTPKGWIGYTYWQTQNKNSIMTKHIFITEKKIFPEERIEPPYQSRSCFVWVVVLLTFSVYWGEMFVWANTEQLQNPITIEDYALIFYGIVIPIGYIGVLFRQNWALLLSALPRLLWVGAALYGISDIDAGGFELLLYLTLFYEFFVALVCILYFVWSVSIRKVSENNLNKKQNSDIISLKTTEHTE